VAIVTGAAGGIGTQITKHLLQCNYRVVLADIDTTKGPLLQKELGSNTLFVECNVSDWDSQASMFKQAFEWGGGRIDFLAANAGVPDKESFFRLPAPSEELEPTKPIMASYGVNFFGTIYGLRLLRHYARKSSIQEGGKMVVTASAAGLYPMYLSPIYAAAKHGIVGLVRSAAPKLWRDEHVTINTVCPGPIDTGIADFSHIIPTGYYTKMSVVIDAYDKFIKEDVTGQVAECSNECFYLRDHPEFSNDVARFLVE
ncbi:hypothetical protein DL95DRAFT_230819, partial [Leptodontidium sp. 2 PMI_412]